MKSSDLLDRIGKRFCETATWPRYVELDLIYLDSGGLEPILSKVGLDIVDVWGNDEDAEVRLSTLEAYKKHASCGKKDLARFAKAAGFFAEQVKAKRTGDSNDKLRISASEIGNKIGIKGIELDRLVRLIEQFGGSRLHSGGTRGENFKEWSFTVRNKSIYFTGVTNYQEYIERKRLVEKNENKKREREEERRKKLYGTKSDFTLKPGLSDVPAETENLYVSLHPAVESTSRKLLEDGHCTEAVQRAAQRFEAFLQDIIGDHENYGLPLVGKAFGGDQPLIALNPGETKKDETEQNGFHFLSRGIISALRNFHSHGHPEDIERNEAIEYLAIISAVWKRLELASNNN